jgi:3-hydroxyacyl-CoA dehydrogenase/enoyl-CoA hydratase/3-hydroxybutyryl-CoA epimerase
MQFIYGTGVEAFFKRADELTAKYGAGFALDNNTRNAIALSVPVY